MPTQKSAKKSKKTDNNQAADSGKDYLEKLEKMHDRVVKDFYGI